VIDAIDPRYDRGVTVRMVGDAGHLTNYGYTRFRERHIPMWSATCPHHARQVHGRGRPVRVRRHRQLVRLGPAQNSNNFFMIDSPYVAADFTAEFEQMFNGVFGHNKVELDNGRVYEVGDTTVEVWFAPNEDAMGRMLELVDGARRASVHDLRVHQGPARRRADPQAARVRGAGPAGRGRPGDRSATYGVSGVIDQSQLHSNGQYHEVYRLLGAGIPLQMDGNDNSESSPATTRPAAAACTARR
jgi:hypothetical protein